MTPVAVQDTSTNSTALEAVADPSVIRNVITLKFQDTRIDTKQQPVLQYLTAIAIPPGTTTADTSDSIILPWRSTGRTNTQVPSTASST